MLWVRQGALALVVALATAACAGGLGLGRQYEYEEQLYLDVDGSAVITVAASIPALVALRGLPLDPAPNARTDRAEVRRALEARGCTVDNVGQGWRRRGRRFVQFRISTDDVRTLPACGALAWSTYALALDPEDNLLKYRQTVGASAAGDPGAAGWDGSELVAFKLHLPSRVQHQNVRLLEDNAPGAVERGNILTWEQRLEDRRKGSPVALEVFMEPTSILFTTLWLFAAAFAAAMTMLAALVWWVKRKGRGHILN
jgi:hypothetical protein